MFATLFKRAEATVDSAIGRVVNRVIIAIPFLVAAGFATAALYLRLERMSGAESASLILAGIFVFAGLTAFLVFGGSAPPVEAPLADQTAEQVTTDSAEETAPAMSQADKELVMAALTSAAPIALPAIVRGILRNLPLVAVIVAALMVFLVSPMEQSENHSTASNA